MKRRQFGMAITSACLVPSTRWANAETWPARPVKMIVSQAAGTGTDAIARLLANHLAQTWKQAVVVENRPGGQNTIGAAQAAKSPNDGYTLFFATLAALVSNAYLFKSLPYDPRKDFLPLGVISKVPFIVCVNPSQPAKTLRELLDHAKTAPGRVSIADEGPKTFSGMLTRLLAAEGNVQFNSIAYTSSSAAANDTVGGQTDALVTDLPSSIGLIRSGRLRPLAVTTAKRFVGLDVPPVSDVLPGFDYAGWLSLVAPAGIPQPAAERIHRDLNAFLSDREVGKKIESIGPVIEPPTSLDGTADFLKAEHERWAVLTKRIGVLPE